jgi:hypothetical protein
LENNTIHCKKHLQPKVLLQDTKELTYLFIITFILIIITADLGFGLWSFGRGSLHRYLNSHREKTRIKKQTT